MSYEQQPEKTTNEGPSLSSEQDYLYSNTSNNEIELVKDDFNVNHIEVPESWNLGNDPDSAEPDNNNQQTKPQDDQNPDQYNSSHLSQNTYQDPTPQSYQAENVNSKYIGKLFVGGLSWETNEDRLKEYFSKYGEVTECNIMRDQATNRPRGFGFVTFADSASISRVLQEPAHFVDDKRIDPKPAVPRDQQTSNSNNYQNNMGQQSGLGGMHQSQGDQSSEQRSDTLFAGGLPPTVIDEDLRKAFEKFGNIVEVKMMVDRETGRPRGFAFIQFDSEVSVQNAIKECESGDGLIIHDKRIDVKRAVHKKKNNQNDMMASNTNASNMYQYGYGNTGVMPYGMNSMGMMPGMGYGQGMNMGMSSGMGMGMGMNPNMMNSYGYNMMNPAMMNSYAYMMNPTMMGSMDYQGAQAGYANANQAAMGASNPMQMYGYAGYDGTAAAVTGADPAASYIDNTNASPSGSSMKNTTLNSIKDQEYSPAGSQTNPDSRGSKAQSWNSNSNNSNYDNSGYKGGRSNNEGSAERSRDRRDRRDNSKDGGRRDRSGERDRAGRSYNRQQQQQSRSYGSGGNTNYSR